MWTADFGRALSDYDAGGAAGELAPAWTQGSEGVEELTATVRRVCGLAEHQHLADGILRCNPGSTGVILPRFTCFAWRSQKAPRSLRNAACRSRPTMRFQPSGHSFRSWLMSPRRRTPGTDGLVRIGLPGPPVGGATQQGMPHVCKIVVASSSSLEVAARMFSSREETTRSEALCLRQ